MSQGSYQQSLNYQNNETVSVGEWIGAIILSCIPVVGIIMMFVWAFGSSAKPSKKNFYRASLIIAAIILVINIIVWVLIAIAAGGFAEMISSYLN